MMQNMGTRRWWVLGAMALSLLAVGLDLTVLNLALPTLATDMHASTGQLQWFADAYNLVLAAALLPAGMLGDRYGRKKIMLTALVLFGIASVVCAYSSSAGMLIAARASLGLGAAFLMPLSASVLPVLFSEEERPKALAVWVTANSIGFPLGPIVGGWLLNTYWWGSVFLINVPLIVIAIVAVSVLLPESRGTSRSEMDWIGVGLSSLGLVGVTYGVIEAGENGWENTVALAAMVVGVLLLICFAAWQRRTKHPLVEMSLFQSRGFMWGSMLATLVSFAIFGLLFSIPQYFQAVRGVDALGTGLRLLPMIGGLLVGAQVGSRVTPKAGAKATVAVGFALLALGLGIGSATDVHSGLGFAATWIGLVGVGMGLSLPAAMDAALGALSKERSGVGTALMMALRQVGGTIGVALLGTVISSFYRNSLDVGMLPATIAAAARSSASVGVSVATSLHSLPLLNAVRVAFVEGMDALLWVCGGIAVLGIILTVLFLPQRSSKVENRSIAS